MARVIECQSKEWENCKGPCLGKITNLADLVEACPADTFSFLVKILETQLFRDLQSSYRYLMHIVQLHSKVRRHHLLLVYYILKL